MQHERDDVLRHIDRKIESYKKRQTDASTPKDHAYDFGVSAQTLGILAGDIRAGVHASDRPVHDAERQSDEWFCVRCYKRWGTDEEGPEQCL
jgi:hypothetical protein